MELFVSFVLPAFKAKFLAESIDSILAQTYTNFELIIVDDCSPEDLKIIVDHYDDSRISYYRNEKNLGGNSLIAQWDHSIKYAKGDYIVLAADDDTYSPTFLERCVDLATKYPEVNLIRARVNCIDEYSADLSHEGVLREYISQAEYIYHWGLATIYICIGNFMFKSEVLKKRQFVDFPSAFCSDIATSIMMADHGVANSKELLFNFRISAIHLSSSINDKQLNDKLLANNEFYKWLFALDIKKPPHAEDQVYLDKIQYKNLYGKFVFDAFNQVYKYLPLSKMHYVFRFTEITFMDKGKMMLRYFYHKFFK